MAREAVGRLTHFEVHALRGTRWTIEVGLEDGELALEQARQVLQRADVDGVKVWKELHDPATGESAGRMVLCELKPKPKERWSFRVRRTTDNREAATAPRRRPIAPPPAQPTDWALAWFSIGGACVALVALAALAAID